MNNKPFVLIYFSRHKGIVRRFQISFPCAAQAFRMGEDLLDWWPVHRVEVWDGDRRMLLAVS